MISRSAAIAGLLVTACGGTSSDPGLTAMLQVERAQFRPGTFPADSGGPATLALQSQHAAITIGELGESVRGTLGLGGRAAAIGVVGFADAWLVVAGPGELDTPDNPSARARIGVADPFPPGPFTLIMAAADERGAFGPPTTLDLVAEPTPPPDGELVIELVWESAADLDLHVVEPGPNGGEAYSGDPNTFDPPPGEPVDPLEFRRHGILDRDGNKACRRDGRPSEHVIWSEPAPSGDYIVRVDTPSLCGDPSAAWHVAAYRKHNGVVTLVAAARGVAVADDVVQPRGRGAGVLALRFTL